jgi:hypothetical protein
VTAQLVPRGLARGYRHTIIALALLAVGGVVVASVLGRPLAGVMLCVGLLLGTVNGLMVLSSINRATEGESVNKRAFVFGSMRRLALVTAVALTLSFTFAPEGYAVLAGLALCQLLVLANASGAMLREVRRG